MGMRWPAGLAPRGPAEVADVVEISTAAMLAAKIHEVPEIRAELVARVKAEIQAGTYETPERLDAAIDGLLKPWVKHYRLPTGVVYWLKDVVIEPH